MLYFSNCAISARKKLCFFQNFPYFFLIRTSKKVLTAHRGSIYQIKADEMPFPRQKKLFRFDKSVCIGRTLKSDLSSIFWGNPGEILHIGWKIVDNIWERIWEKGPIGNFSRHEI